MDIIAAIIGGIFSLACVYLNYYLINKESTEHNEKNRKNPRSKSRKKFMSAAFFFFMPLIAIIIAVNAEAHNDLIVTLAVAWLIGIIYSLFLIIGILGIVGVIATIGLVLWLDKQPDWDWWGLIDGDIDPEAIRELGFNMTMVHIPSGSFQMGCVGERDRDCTDNEKPPRTVTVSAFMLSKYPVTFDQWDFCVVDGGCTRPPRDRGWGRGNRPVIGVSYNDITQQFLPWLNRRTGEIYRLPSEAEWEYTCRAGEHYNFCGSNSAGDVAWFKDNSDTGQGRRTQPVGGKAPNTFGLHDMSGNVWEWTQDCWNHNYRGAPSDGFAWTSGNCDLRVVRGGSWFNEERSVRAAYRSLSVPSARYGNYGFRVVRMLP